MDITDAELETLVADFRAWLEAHRAPAARPPPTTPPALQGVDTSRWTCSFEDRFGVPGLPDWTKWDSVLPNSDHALSGSSEFGNHELQWYINHRGPLGITPWRVGPDGLSITAAPLPADLVPHIGYDQAGAHNLGAYRYSSGLLHNKAVFGQTYGYFEIDCQMPAGRGLWPAFWLLPASGAWPPEIDIFEVLGHEPNRLYTTLHGVGVPNLHIEAWVDTTARHRYGVLWDALKITLYIDGQPAGGGAIPCSVSEPMFMLLNLAVGGDWPGPPDPTTRFPATLQVHSVRAWRFG